MKLWKNRKLPKSDTGYTYGGGIEELYEEWSERRTPFLYMPEDLPAPDIDFAPLKEAIIPNLPDYDGPRPQRSDYYTQALRMKPRFSGRPELHYLLGCLIMMSRRDHFPEEMKKLWHRLWEEEGEFLMDTLSLRWKISAMVTFGEHGNSEAERHLGREIFMLTGLMKLHDTERSFSGKAPNQGFDLDGRTDKSRRMSALGMTPYSIGAGDLDRIIFALIYGKILEAGDSPCALLAYAILDEINRSRSSVFRRLIMLRRELRARKLAKKAAKAEGDGES